MKQIFRNFTYLIKKFKTSSILNFAGLAVAIMVFIIAIIQVRYTSNYNKSFDKSGYIHYVSSIYPDYDNQRGFAYSKDAIVLAAERFPEIKNYCFTQYYIPDKDFYKADNKDEIFTIRSIYINESFAEIFTPEIISGSYTEIFESTTQLSGMLSESIAKKLFGKEDPIGQQLHMKALDQAYTRDTVEQAVTIKAVCKDYPENTFIGSGIFLPLEELGGDWYSVYIEIDPEDAGALQTKMNNDTLIKEVSYGTEVEIYPYYELAEYFPAFGDQIGNKNTNLALLAIGILTLIIAFINYINFSVSMAPVRARTFNIQKIMGAKTSVIKTVIISEPVIFSSISFILSLLIISVFKTYIKNAFIIADLSPVNNVEILSMVFLIIVFFSLLAGIYPACYATISQPAVVVNGKHSLSRKSSVFRNILIGIQFFAAVTFIIIALFIRLQYDYVTNYSLGMEKENIVYLPYSINNDLKTFGDELTKNPEILDYTASSFLPGMVFGQVSGSLINNKFMEITAWPVSENFLDFFGVNMVEGETFTKTNQSDKRQIIVNENAVKQYELENIVGIEELYEFDFSNYHGEQKQYLHRINGIAEDVKFQYLKHPVSPMMFVYTPNDNYYWIFVKISGNDIQSTISYIENTWKKFSNEKFEINFLDETLDSLYVMENSLSKTISLFSIIAVLIAIMGVYGLIIFNAKYKEKEIAIRKVNGASVKEIIFLINRNTLGLFVISFLISVPTAYFIMKRWLENFAYKIDIYWWVFLAGGLLVFIITLITVSGQSYKSATTNPTKSLQKE
ncbi:MAG: ABC transporter permease [Bacteroidales bacterium]|jgi:putative ABC transport system permease protein|nr:ABC transporter permease [Bacteroidales bacterium]